MVDGGRAGPVGASVLAIALSAVLALACGSDDDGSSGAASPSTGEPSASVEEATTTAPDRDARSGSSTASPATDAAAATDAVVPGADPEVDAVVTAWTTVFDSATPVDAKGPHLQEADALRATLEAYAGAGSQVGGIALVPSGVRIDGDTAIITYDVNFAGTEAYGDQTGRVVRADGSWTVSREQFCAFMASARTPCPE